MQAKAPHIKASASSILVTLAAFVIVVAGMRAAQDMMVPFLLSLFIAVISAPALFWLEEHGLPRLLAMLVVVSGIIATGVGLTAFVGSSVRALQPRRSRSTSSASTTLPAGVLDWLRGKGARRSTRPTCSQYLEPGAAIMQVAGDRLQRLRQHAHQLLPDRDDGGVHPVRDQQLSPASWRAVVRDPEHSMRPLRAVHLQPAGATWRSRPWRAWAPELAVIALWLWVMGVDYPLLWGLLAFMLNYVPNIGSIIAAVPAVLLALVQIGPGGGPRWPPPAILVVNVVVGNFIEPQVHGAGPGPVDPGGVPVSPVLGLDPRPGGHVPVGAADHDGLKIALDSRDETRWVAILLGSGPRRAPRARYRDAVMARQVAITGGPGRAAAPARCQAAGSATCSQHAPCRSVALFSRPGDSACSLRGRTGRRQGQPSHRRRRFASLCGDRSHGGLTSRLTCPSFLLHRGGDVGCSALLRGR